MAARCRLLAGLWERESVIILPNIPLKSEDSHRLKLQSSTLGHADAPHLLTLSTELQAIIAGYVR